MLAAASCTKSNPTKLVNPSITRITQGQRATMSSSDEEWAPSDSSSGDESSDGGGGQAARGRKRKATAKAQGGTVKRSSYRGKTKN